MNISNLEVGQVIKNYKELCKILDEKVKTGESKKSQIKEFERYFSYNKDGNKFIIQEIYDSPKSKIDNRQNGNNTLYSDMIQDLLMDILVQNATNENKLVLLLGANKLLRLLCMVSENYGYCRQNIPKLGTYMNIENDFIYDFYDVNHKNLESRLINALEKLAKKSLIFWSIEKAVIVENVRIKRNELGEIELSEVDLDTYDFTKGEKRHRINYEVVTTHRQATDKEVEIILQTEAEVMEEMGFENKQSIFLGGSWQTFTKMVNKMLHKKANILFAYNAYKIICNRDYIIKEYEDLKLMEMTDFERNKNKNKLNKTVIDSLEYNATRRHEKISDKILGTPKEVKDIMRISEMYVDNNKKLIDVLIDKDAKNIISQVKEITPDKNNYISTEQNGSDLELAEDYLETLL